jgi:hypothetical protein
LPWVSIPGIIAAAGGASMAIQLYQWRNCSNLFDFVMGVIKKNPTDMDAAFNQGDGPQILVISAVTGVTIVACYYSPLGRLVTDYAKAKWAEIVNYIKSIFTANKVPVYKLPISLF